MEILKTLVLDFDRNNYNTTIAAKQGDTKSRYIEVILTKNGLAIDITNHTVKVFVRKPDNSIVFNNVEVLDAANGKVKIELTNQMLAIIGLSKYEISIYGADDSILATQTFCVNIEGTLRDDNAIESSNEFTALTEALNDIEQAKEDIGVLGSLNTELENNISAGNTLKTGLEADITAGNTLKTALETDIATATTKKTDLQNVIATANTTTYATKGEINSVNTALNDIPNKSYITEKAKVVDVNNALALKTDKAYTDTQLSLMRNKLEPIVMGDLGQDVKTGMTGGSVAVVSGESTGFNNLNSSTKDALGKYENIIFTQFNTVSEATDIAVVNDGKWYKGRFNSVGVYGSNNFADYTKIPVVAGDRFKITASFYGDTWYCVSIYNASNVLLQNLLPGNTSAFKTYTDEVIVIPMNASYMVVQTGDINYKTIKKMKIIDVSSFKTDYDNTKNTVNILNTIVTDGISYNEFADDLKVALGTYSALSANWINGRYDATGIFQTNGSNYCTEIACSGGDKFLITTKMYQNTFFSAIAVNASGDVLAKYMPGALNDYITYTDYTITVPVGTTKLRLTTVDIAYKNVKKSGIIDINSLNIQSLTKNNPSLCIGSKIYAVVGDTIQLFHKSIVDSFEGYFLAISCSKGKNYPRYWEYTPVSGDIGTTTMTLTLYNKDGTTIETKTISIITVTTVNPGSSKKVLHIGDSLISSGQIPIELSRRLKGTTGVATSPTALNLSNFSIVGRLKNAGLTVGWEGTGGWTFSTYKTSTGIQSVRWQVSGITNANIGDIYQVNYAGGYYRFQVMEINVTNGSGNIMMAFYSTPYSVDFAIQVAASSTLSLVSGTGQASITYNSYAVENYQPFWNTITGTFDINTYVNTYCNGQVDYIYMQLGINSYINSTPFDSLNSILADCKALIDSIHAQLPSCVIMLATNCLPSQNGGIGYSYNASSNADIYGEYGFNRKVFEMNKLFMTLENDVNYNTFVKVINVHAQVDSDNVYPTTSKTLNTRIATTELMSTNAVHPANEGYWQIADAEFRALIGLTQS